MKRLAAYYGILVLAAALALAARGRCDTIPLQAQQTATRTVELSWNAAQDAAVVLRRYADEAQYRQVATVAASQYVDRHGRSVCGDTVYYIVACGADSGWTSLSVAKMDPTMPAEWGVVSVDQASQKIRLQWQPSADTDIMGYIVCEGSPSIAVDTVFGGASSSYTFLAGSADTVYNFRICAFDSCRQASPLTEVCNNIVVAIDAEPCSRTVTAYWNSYRNMPGGVGRYELWASEDGGAFRSVATVGADVLSHSFEVGAGCMTLRVFVAANSAEQLLSSSSNVCEYQFSTAERPAYLYLRKVTVDGDDGIVRVEAQTDPSFGGDDYTVYRSVDGGAWNAAGVCSPAADGRLVWHDRAARPSEAVYSYRIGVRDGCGRNEILTRQGSTLKPTIQQQGGSTVLVWNGYEGWSGTTGYQIVACGAADDIWQTIGSTLETSFMDEATEMRRYKILAFEGGDSEFRQGDSLQSVSVFHRPHTDVWVPTAFTPLESTNNRFTPQFTYVDSEGYSLVVYNRQGLVVFSTTDPQAAWDGKYDGRPLPGGAYVYKITYGQSDGTTQYLLGTVMIVY